MKVQQNILIGILLLLVMNGLNAQPGNYVKPILPSQPNGSPLFGKDIVIDDIPSQNQRQEIVRSAFNGWLYTEYSSIDPVYNTPVTTVMKSIDNGITWTMLINLVWPSPYKSFICTDLAVGGDSISNIKLFLVWVASVSIDPTADRGDAWISRFNGITGENEYGYIIDNPVAGISNATDFNYPASNSNPYSVGILYSKYSSAKDSIILRSSSNGGLSFENRKALASSDGRISKVALTYGRSPSWSSGRYFAAWEEKVDIGTTLGHVYTAHTDPNFNSPLTTPVNLDGLDITDLNSCRNPKIACQKSNIDNDSLNLTEIVLFDKYNISNQNYEITAYYNLQAPNHSNFKKIIISNAAHYSCQSSIDFNPYDSSFMVTFYDSTTQKLPFLQNNFNLRNPANWQFVSAGYNDSTNISSPQPMVALNIGEKKGVNVWANEGTGGNGIAMFDSPYSIWTGIYGDENTANSRYFNVYPNPCSSSFLNIAFNSISNEHVTIVLYSNIGSKLTNVTDKGFSNGFNLIHFNTSGLSSGTYILFIKAREFVKTFKVLIIRQI